MGEDKQEIQDRRFFVNGKKRGENRGNDRWKITDESSIVENYFDKVRKKDENEDRRKRIWNFFFIVLGPQELCFKIDNSIDSSKN